MNYKFVDSINQVDADVWDELNPSHSPVMQFEFFKALEASKSASSDAGWTPHHLVFNDESQICQQKQKKGILPLYIKTHSWGEYVFDWSWAEAFQRYGLDYYPKLVSTIPFTPIPTDKLLSREVNISEVFNRLIGECMQNNFQSWHLLFCPEVNEPLPNDIFHRHTVQFHWFNKGYLSFTDYLAEFTARKRKNTFKERLSIEKQNVVVRQVKGRDVDQKLLAFFYLTYQITYMRKGHQPHLSFEFFQQIFATLPDNLLLVVASKNDEDIACALFIYDDKTLYGRYWGCTEHIKNLHFELCYYQGIEFCINNKTLSFNPGTQGEHKIQRGFEPVLTHSYHWIKDERFSQAIAEFCQQERKQMHYYMKQCQQALPFKQLSNN